MTLNKNSPIASFSRRLCLLMLTGYASVGQFAIADDYADARADLIAAYQAEDFAAMRVAADKALDARPGYPGALFNRALAEVLDGDAETALATVAGLAASGVDHGIAEIPEFESLQELPGWAVYVKSVAKLAEPVGIATTAYSHDVADFIPEGIAIGGDGELYLGGVRHGTIVRIDGTAEVISEANGHWSAFGMRLDGNGGLWFASAAVPEFAKNSEAVSGRTGLFRLHLKSKQITHKALLPAIDEPQVIGDLVLTGDDTVLATESLTGALLRYSISAESFTTLIAPGVLRSMQGLVLDETGQYLYISDYVGGLFRVTLANNEVERVTADDSVSLFGIDGLYRYGKKLIAIQNGIRPHRVVALTLSGDGNAIESAEILAMNLPQFDEPTLGTVVGDDFYFVANSHWNRFDRDSNLPQDLEGPVVLKIRLSQ